MKQGMNAERQSKETTAEELRQHLEIAIENKDWIRVVALANELADRDAENGGKYELPLEQRIQKYAAIVEGRKAEEKAA